MTVHVAVVEDEQLFTDTLCGYLDRFAKENEITFRIDTYPSPIMLLEHYKADYDIIFMDIQMPDINGMEAARRLRAVDQKVILIFVTSLAQYAIDGYSVSAMDYILKPVQYYSFAMKLTKAIWRLDSAEEESLVVSTEAGSGRVRIKDILYVEIRGHMMTYHTHEGNYYGFGTLITLEEKLSEKGFARCNSCYLVNLDYVKGVKGYTLTLQNNEELKISQPKKKSFLLALKAYHGEE